MEGSRLHVFCIRGGPHTRSSTLECEIQALRSAILRQLLATPEDRTRPLFENE